eukprot:TRINITY_DN10436_c0_g1_i1.p1 TRINITY_DN10436_c0_g1~~TRINITY_DN10436_c0_g1_i1.p1  ORF type:complete len:478 (+),score=125.25 TRINITY_DN10436_c0_g1_i1:118-1551(+)
MQEAGSMGGPGAGGMYAPLPWGKSPEFSHPAMGQMFDAYMKMVESTAHSIMMQNAGYGAPSSQAPAAPAAAPTPTPTPTAQAQPPQKEEVRRSMPPSRAAPRAPQAQAQDALASSSFQREGWLWEKKKRGLQKLQKRYYVLKDEWFYYYPKEPRAKDTHPTEIVGLWGYTLGQQHDKDTPFLVLTHPVQRDFYLQAESPFDLEQWMNALQGAISQLPMERPESVTHTPFCTLIVDPIPETVKAGGASGRNTARKKLHSFSKELTKRNKPVAGGKPVAAAAAAGPVFAVPLDQIGAVEDGVPAIVLRSIEALRPHKSLMGIFRKSGSALAIQELKKRFDKGENVDLTAVDDPHAVAGLLKLFFREMPEPLLPFDAYEEFEEAANEPDAASRKLMIQTTVSSLPEMNQCILKALITFLDEVQQLEATNKMSAQNLAIVFSPNILRKKDATMIEAMMQSKVGNLIVCNMIEWCSDLFSLA